MNDEYMIDVICDLTQVVYLTDTNRYMLITCMHCIVFFCSMFYAAVINFQSLYFLE